MRGCKTSHADHTQRVVGEPEGVCSSELTGQKIASSVCWVAKLSGTRIRHDGIQSEVASTAGDVEPEMRIPLHRSPCAVDLRFGRSWKRHIDWIFARADLEHAKAATNGGYGAHTPQDRFQVNCGESMDFKVYIFALAIEQRIANTAAHHPGATPLRGHCACDAMGKVVFMERSNVGRDSQMFSMGTAVQSGQLK